MGDLWVSIMGKLAQGVQDVQARVGHRNESKGQGYCSPQGGLPITQLIQLIEETRKTVPYYFKNLHLITLPF